MTTSDPPPTPTEWSELELSEQIERLFGPCEWARRVKALEDMRDAANELYRSLIQDSHWCQWTHRVEQAQLKFADVMRRDCRHMKVAMHIERRGGVNNVGDPYVELEEVVTCVECGKVISKAPPTEEDIPF